MLVDLSNVPVAEVLRRLSRERRSGDLEVRSGKVVKTVYFDHGRIVFAASNMRKDRLGEALLGLGRITDEDFSRASALMRSDRRRRFGEALVQAGALDKKELGSAVSRQVKQIVVSLFGLEGAASFVERPCPIPLEYMVSLSLHRVLYMGIKAMKSDALVQAGLGNLDQWVKLATVPPFRFGVRKCSAEELDILEQASRRVTLRRLAWDKGGLSPTRLKAAYGLLAAGILTLADKHEGPAESPVVQMETSTFLLSALRSRPDPSAREALQQEVQEELQRSARLDREAWLRVSRTAPREEIVRALEEKMERYHALLDAVGDDQALRTDIELILGRASTMLRLARTTPLAAAPPAPAPPPSTATGPDAPSVTQSLPAVAPAAAGPARPVAAPEAEPSGEPGAAPHEAPAEGEAPAGGEASAAAPMDERERAVLLNDIQRYIMEGDVRMAVSDYANAVKVYTNLVDLAPDISAYHLRLAIAMACWPRTQKQAEREFLEAVRLDPNNADLHYQFGLYYKAMKVKSRAIAVFQTAVRLNPHHKNARAELEALSPKDSTLQSLRKLFRS
jgi:tetratricopeptide (TPR) repeat protein